MLRWSAPISPLRLWLQSSSLLAVVAGYSLLLLFNQQVARLQRAQAHRDLVAQVAADLSAKARTRQQLQRLLPDVWAPGLRLQVLWSAPPANPAVADGTLRLGDQALVSQVPLALADGSRVVLQLEQNVAASIQQERLAFWLLVVAAGLSSLFTSALLRLVLRRGLVRPLAEFTAQLQTTQAPPSPQDAIDPAAQPDELRPIALAFNALQERLRASWERQQAFVDGVAHELRTPITLISGHTQSLQRRYPEAQALRLIQAEAERMATLVRDLLDLARQDAGRLTLRRQPVEGDDALLTLYERMAPHAAGRLKLLLPAPEAPCPQGLGDPDRLQQCLTTLVDNALQYSGPLLPVELACERAASGELVLHVRDHGPGVATDEREVIFERFVRGHAGRLSEQRGSGIGLSVVKLLIDAMGGRVLVAEAPGGGADFQLWLPPVRPSALPPSP